MIKPTPLRAATLKQQAMITQHSGKGASGKLVWNQHYTFTLHLQYILKFMLDNKIIIHILGFKKKNLSQSLLQIGNPMGHVFCVWFFFFLNYFFFKFLIVSRIFKFESVSTFVQCETGHWTLIIAWTRYKTKRIQEIWIVKCDTIKGNEWHVGNIQFWVFHINHLYI